jgi:signal transduction histidine kinase
MTPDDPIARDVEAVSRLGAVPSILEVICRSTGLRFAAVARVTDTRWVACAVRDEIEFGLLPGGELELKTTICDEIRQSGQAVVIDQVSSDAQFCGHHTPAQYGFESYISMPILRANGDFFGTLCALDPRPARLRQPQVVKTFELFAQLISLQLDADDKLHESQKALEKEQETAQLRDQFVAVLGHDLRTPLSVVMSGAEVLMRLPLPGKGIEIAERMLRSADRMSRLVDNILDFARGRLGSGILVQKHQDVLLEQQLQQIVAELTAIHPQRHINLKLDIADAVVCDTGRIGQLLSNLVSNALTHGFDNTPVIVSGVARAGRFTLSVENQGPPIANEAIDKLFQPFSRFTSSKRSGGLGLGLYIARQIAIAHAGELSVESSTAFTRFTFTMPCRP